MKIKVGDGSYFKNYEKRGKKLMKLSPLSKVQINTE